MTRLRRFVCWLKGHRLELVQLDVPAKHGLSRRVEYLRCARCRATTQASVSPPRRAPRLRQRTVTR